MAALEEKQNDVVKTTQDYIEELSIKTIEEFNKKYDHSAKKVIKRLFYLKEGYEIYRVPVKDKSNHIIIVRKVSVSNNNQREWSNYSKLYPLMRKTKLLNYYDLYFSTENNIDYLLLTMEELQMTLKDYVTSKYINNGPGITENECKSIIKSIITENGYIILVSTRNESICK